MTDIKNVDDGKPFINMEKYEPYLKKPLYLGKICEHLTHNTKVLGRQLHRYFFGIEKTRNPQNIVDNQKVEVIKKNLSIQADLIIALMINNAQTLGIGKIERPTNTNFPSSKFTFNENQDEKKVSELKMYLSVLDLIYAEGKLSESNKFPLPNLKQQEEDLETIANLK